MFVSTNLFHISKLLFLVFVVSVSQLKPNNRNELITRTKFMPLFFLFIIFFVNYTSIIALLLNPYLIYEYFSLNCNFISYKMSIFFFFLLPMMINLHFNNIHRSDLEMIVVGCGITDIFCYVVGKYVMDGQAKDNIPIISYISPNKSYAGFIGGSCISFMFMTILGGYDQVKVIYIIPLCIIGDLLFSLVKRLLNVKDFGSILASHGGAIDRLDSILFTMFVLNNINYLTIL